MYLKVNKSNSRKMSYKLQDTSYKCSGGVHLRPIPIKNYRRGNPCGYPFQADRAKPYGIFMLIILFFFMFLFTNCDRNPTRNILINSLTLNHTAITLNIGDTERLEVIYTPENATKTELIWSSSEKEMEIVLFVDGEITALSAGTVIITVSTLDGLISDECEITVLEDFIPVTEVTLNKNYHYMKIGETEQLEVVITPENATDPELIWLSSDENVAIVNETGNVTAVGYGNATILSSTPCGTISDECEITVHEVYTFYIGNEEQWNTAIETIKQDFEHNSFNIILIDDFSLTGAIDNTFGDRNDVSITISGNHSISLDTDTKGNLLRIDNEQTIILIDVHLIGHDNNDISLVYITDNNSTFTMKGISSIKGNTADTGGGVYNNGIFIMENFSSIEENNSIRSNGGVTNTGSFEMYHNSSISKNNALGSRQTDIGVGGVFNEGFFAMFDNSSISENTCYFNGGGIYNTGSFSMLDNSFIKKNEIKGEYSQNSILIGGGGIHNRGNMSIANYAEISENISIFQGGGIYNHSGVGYISDNVTIQNNRVSTIHITIPTAGGGIANTGEIRISGNVLIKGNRASKGGGLYSLTHLYISEHVSITENTASYGGGIFAEAPPQVLNGSHVTISDNVSIFKNSAGYGAGIMLDYLSFLNMYGGTVYGSISAGVLSSLANVNSDVYFRNAALHAEGGLARYSDGSNVLPHTDGFLYYTDYTIIGR